MAQKIIITIKTLTPTDENSFVNMEFGNTLGPYLITNKSFVNTGIGIPLYLFILEDYATINELAQDVKVAFDTEFTDSGYTFSSEIVDNVITYYLGSNATVDYFDYLGADFIDTELWSVVREAVAIPEETDPVVYDDEVILSRSPYFFSVSPTDLYDSIRADIYVYRGHKVDDKPLLPNFQLSKFVLQAGQPKISINVNKLVNDFVQNSFNQNISVGVQTTSQLDSVWVYVDAGVYLNNVLLYPVTQTLLALDGFGYHQELSNPVLNKKVLSTINNHIVYNNSKYPLYFVSKDLVSITINDTSVPFTLDENYNNQYIGYVDVMQYADGDTNFNAVFVYDDETITHTIEVKTECRNNLINCIFKNKYGFWQKIPFNKLSKKSLDIESQDYTPFISDFGSYNLNQHNKRSYLTNGKEKIVTNTDFLPEYYNNLFKELMLSEQIYLEENNVVLPVNINKRSLQYKTKLNDKLIQYSLDFEYSFNALNNVN